MNMLRVTWGLSAVMWFAFVVLTCVALGWQAAYVAMVFAIMPDIALVGGFVERGRLKPGRVKLYNVLHTMTYPIALLAIGIAVFALTGWINGGFWPIALAGATWFVHIATDRALGVGFRDAEGRVLPVGVSP